MPSTQEIINYKTTAISAIVNTPEIVRAIDPNYIGNGEGLIYKNIFPYGYIPETVEEAKCYILITVDMPHVWSESSYLFRKVVVSFYIVCHQRLMQTDYGGTRIDYIAEELEKLFGGSSDFGFGEMELISSTEENPDFEHRARVMQFQTKKPVKSWCHQ